MLLTPLATGVVIAQEPGGNRSGGPLDQGECREFNRRLRGGARFNGELGRETNTAQSPSSFAGQYSIQRSFFAGGDINNDGVPDTVSVVTRITVDPSDPSGKTYIGHNLNGQLTFQDQRGSFLLPGCIIIDAGSGNDILRAFAKPTMSILIALRLP
jgi:hypothetical protein